MVSKRQGREDGHRRKFLAIVDETPECERAITYAARRAINTGGGLVLLYVIAPADFQHWIGVGEIMRAEAVESAEKALNNFAQHLKDTVGIQAEVLTRQGVASTEIHALIEEDQDISILVLAAGGEQEGPGPLVQSVAGKGASFPIPVTVVPHSLTDDDIESLV